MTSPEEAMTSPEALREYWRASGMQSEAAIDHVIPGEHCYDGVWYPGNIPSAALTRTKSFQFRDSDVVLATYPKSGTTWMSAILCELLNITQTNAQEKLEYIEMKLYHMQKMGIENIEQLPDPRFYKTHLMVDYFKNPLSENKTKFIVIMRNVKDTLVSFYHFYRSHSYLGNFKGSFSDFMEMVKVNRVRSWFDWIEGWWKYKDNPNVLFLTYEDMKIDTAREIRKVCEFAGFDVDEEAIGEIVKKTSFSSMRTESEKTDPSKRKTPPSFFFRKGIVGDWNEHFTEELNEYIDSIYGQRIASKGLSLAFK